MKRNRRRRRRKKVEDEEKKIQKIERYNDRHGCRPKINLLLGSFDTYRVDQRIKNYSYKELEKMRDKTM
jgi:hypothetical protein